MAAAENSNAARYSWAALLLVIRSRQGVNVPCLDADV